MWDTALIFASMPKGGNCRGHWNGQDKSERACQQPHNFGGGNTDAQQFYSRRLEEIKIGCRDCHDKQELHTQISEHQCINHGSEDIGADVHPRRD